MSDTTIIPQPKIGLEFIKLITATRDDDSVFKVEIPSQITKITDHMIEYKSTIDKAVDPVTGANWAGGGGISRKFWNELVEQGKVKFK